jgi:NitT/TauT family transport system substrate-binding protein
MKTILLALSLVTFALVGSSATADARDLASVRFSLDWTLQGNHAIWGLALKDQDFRANGLDVTMDRGYGTGDTIVKVAAGAYDIGFADISSLIKFNAENPAQHLIAFYQVFDRTPNAIICLKKSGIRSPLDLTGKTIGAPEADASRLIFSAFAKANNIDPASINWLTMAPNLREAMLAQGKVDAISGFASTSVFNLISAGVPREDITVLSYADHGLDLYGSALFATQDYVAKHPDVIKGFVRATISGTISLFKNPNKGMEAMRDIDPMFDTALETERLKFLIERSVLESPALEANGLGYVDPARMAFTIKTNSEVYHFTAPNLDQVYTTDYLPPASERLPPK